MSAKADKEFSVASMLRNERERLAKVEAHARSGGTTYESLMDEMSDVGLIDAYLCGGDITVSISGDKHKLEAVWGILRRHGFKCEGERPKANAPSWSGWFYNEALPGACVYLQFSSSVCRRVKIGTKTVEQDIYETVCGEVTLPETVSA